MRKVQRLRAVMIKGSYLFTGKYWILGPNLEIQLILNNPQSGGVSWTGRIPISLIKRLRYKPSRNFEHLRENDGLGAFEQVIHLHKFRRDEVASFSLGMLDSACISLDTIRSDATITVMKCQASPEQKVLSEIGRVLLKYSIKADYRLKDRIIVVE